MREFDQPHNVLARALDADGWSPMGAHDRQNPAPVFIWDSFNQIIWIGAWDDDAGYFSGWLAWARRVPPGIESPGRIYGADAWQSIPKDLRHLVEI